MMRYIFLTICCLLLSMQARTQSDLVKQFDQYVEQSRKKFDVPGCAVAVVKDGKVVHMKAYGKVSLEGSADANVQTLFGMMSTTKALTALGMGYLVDEGKVHWDDKVIDYLPYFQMPTPYVTNDLRIRDLFTHNAGLGNADYFWALRKGMTTKQILKQIRLAEPAYPLRGGYTYQNIMYLAAGAVIEEISGMSWERFTEERIFDPLGMSNSFPSIAYSAQYQNRSIAHYEIDGEITAIEEMSADGIAPAGSAWSTIEDISKWVQFLLNEGSHNGEQLIKKETLKEILQPQVIVPRNQFYPTTALTNPTWTTYGLGWFQQDYRGEFLAFHTGSLAGRTAIIGLVPNKDFGFYFFGNLDHAELRHALMLQAIDVFAFEDTSSDWSSKIYDLYAGFKRQGEQRMQNVNAARKSDTKLSHPLTAYTGTYSDPYLGDLTVSIKDGALSLWISELAHGQLDHWHFDTFQVSWSERWRGNDFIKFELNPFTGNVDGLSFFGTTFDKK